MPSYFSVEFSFQRKKLYPNLVADTYNVFFRNGFPFKEGYWMHDNMTIDEIITWNQAKLNKGFRLGFTQHVREDYKQILLSNSNFEHLRLFWTYSPNEIHLSWVIPESEVLANEASSVFVGKRITPIIELSRKLWESGTVSLIQSCLELDAGYISLDRVERNKSIPFCNPFLIVNEQVYESVSSIISIDTEVTQLANKGYLLIDRNRFAN